MYIDYPMVKKGSPCWCASFIKSSVVEVVDLSAVSEVVYLLYLVEYSHSQSDRWVKINNLVNFWAIKILSCRVVPIIK
jgi:hypothetical protein